MGEHVPQKDSSCLVVNFSNEAGRVSFDIEHRELPRWISGWKYSPHVR